LREHPIPFHKAIDLGKPAKKLAGQQAPDLEEAYVSFKLDYWLHPEVSFVQVDDDIEDASEDESKKKDTNDITKDSLIKAPKKRKATAK
jgi:replication factor C subunit 1